MISTRGARSNPAVGRVLLAGFACIAGLWLGETRLATLDSSALRGPVGRPLEVSGALLAVPRRDLGEVRLELQTPSGRVAVEAREPVPEVSVGERLLVRGVIAEPDPWLAGLLRRRGMAQVVEARSVTATGTSRGGVAGRLDLVRERAEAALERGIGERESALAKGFVLGQDESIDFRTREEFKRSGLAHLLAVSGQNVILLCLLAWPLLAAIGLTLRARLVTLLALIAVYVVVTGAGPSIQRAGVMGAAGVVAGLAGTPRSRWYALLLAAAVTLAVNPLASGDVGWQLSFAATAGIMLWSRRIAAVLGANGDGTRRALAEGAAVTVAATVATAPLMAFQFEAFSLSALPANLLALPAVAPSMWLGMLGGIAGQLPALPVEPLNWVNSLLLGYIAQVAHWLATPGWAQVELGLRGPAGLALAYTALIALVEVAIRGTQRRAGLALTPAPPGGGRVAVAWWRTRVAALLAGMLALVLWVAAPGGGADPARDDAITVRILDVGQGDSILLDPPGGEPILVDAGPAEAEVAERLRKLGVESLAALIVTHDQSDHAGGAAEVLSSFRVDRLGFARPSVSAIAAARASGTQPLRLSEGSELRSGELTVEVLWPPAVLLEGPAGDPNQLALVILAEWRHLSLLLAADAEAEAVPIDPGAVDVLKVAHHGSEDSGLESLLARAVPKLAVISVGAENPYGHPAPETIAALEEQRVPAIRTDRAGTVTIEADRLGWTVASG